VHTGRLIAWDEDGTARIMDERGEWSPYPILDQRTDR